MRLAALCALLAWASAARADFVRGTIKIDVRDAAGTPQQADVSVHGAGGDAKVARVGDVYVADGLIDGDYSVAVAGGGQTAVHVQGRLDRGVVFVVGGKKAQVIALGARDVACDSVDGAVVEAVAFGKNGALGAGRIDVKKSGKLVCAAIVAGGAATLRLLPGDYEMTAKLVGGGVASEHYKLRRDQTPRALAFRAR